MSSSFENLEVWKVGCRLAVKVIKVMGDCRIFGLRDHEIKSAVSIPSNISEGSERRTSRDFRHFIHIALGSAAELRTQTYIAREAAVNTYTTWVMPDTWLPYPVNGYELRSLRLYERKDL